MLRILQPTKNPSLLFEGQIFVTRTVILQLVLNMSSEKSRWWLSSYVMNLVYANILNVKSIDRRLINL